MYIELLTRMVAKYSPPTALGIFIVSRFIYIEDVNWYIGLFLFFGWWAACEMCSAYEKYEAKRHKEKEV